MTAEKEQIKPDSQLTIDSNLGDALVDSKPMGLTPSEFELLKMLSSSPGRAFSRAELARDVFDGEADVRTVDSHVKNIRAKLHEDARLPRWIKTVHGVGYRLELPDSTMEKVTDASGTALNPARGEGSLVVDEIGHQVFVDGKETPLTRAEYETLLALVRHIGEDVSNERLSLEALGVGFSESGRRLASHIKNLRKKILDDARSPRWIQTVHGYGFRFIGTPAGADQIGHADTQRDAEKNTTAARLQRELADYLSATSQCLMLWHDLEGRYESLVTSLALPAGTTLLDERKVSRFNVKLAINSLAADERVVIYRLRRRRIEESDWLSDVEAFAECFSPEEEEVQEAGPEATPPSSDTVAPTSTLLKDYVLKDDWYTVEEFEGAVEELSIDPSLYEGKVQPWQLGFRKYDDCVLRSTWRSPASYYLSLFDGPLAGAEIPDKIKGTGSFRRFASGGILNGTFYAYDEGSWITRAGLGELGISETDLDTFADSLARHYRSAEISQFTLSSIKNETSDGSLLSYGLCDCFYESVLVSRRDYVESGSLCGKRVFAPKGIPTQGRALVASLVLAEQSIDLEVLLDMLREDYGIPLQRTQLLQLLRATDLFYSPELDRVYIDHDQFVREVE